MARDIIKSYGSLQLAMLHLALPQGQPQPQRGGGAPRDETTRGIGSGGLGEECRTERQPGLSRKSSIDTTSTCSDPEPDRELPARFPGETQGNYIHRLTREQRQECLRREEDDHLWFENLPVDTYMTPPPPPCGTSPRWRERESSVSRIRTPLLSSDSSDEEDRLIERKRERGKTTAKVPIAPSRKPVKRQTSELPDRWDPHAKRPRPNSDESSRDSSQSSESIELPPRWLREKEREYCMRVFGYWHYDLLPGKHIRFDDIPLGRSTLPAPRDES